jgi:hypothetical protein
MASVKIVPTAQIEEWLRSDVTKALIRALNERADWLETARRGIFFPGEPHKTQEAICVVDGQQGEVEYLLTLMSSTDNLEQTFYERVAEWQRDMARRVSGAGQA